MAIITAVVAGLVVPSFAGGVMAMFFVMTGLWRLPEGFRLSVYAIVGYLAAFQLSLALMMNYPILGWSALVGMGVSIFAVFRTRSSQS
ncbi:MAG: hypothetical protein DLM61_27725 [Pseudonocardiales bacterium]|nr:MAG: hypothetical protein DLM61_27725 [Pseudonocardiales bacterium]